jgi:hypothetical protein
MIRRVDHSASHGPGSVLQSRPRTQLKDDLMTRACLKIGVSREAPTELWATRPDGIRRRGDDRSSVRIGAEGGEA